MRFIHLYLVGYFLLLAGAVLALWRGGILVRISSLGLAVSAIVAVSLGILLAVVSSARQAPIAQK